MIINDFLYRKLAEWDKMSRKGFGHYILKKGAHGIAKELKNDEQIKELCESITNKKKNGEQIILEMAGPNTDITNIILDAISEVCGCDSLRGSFIEIVVRETIVRYFFRFLRPP